MNEILDDVVRSLEGAVVEEAVLRKVRNYIRLMASTGRSNEQLVVLGQAYLKEILHPDPRYSGC
jgi:hypothetical protein